VARCLWKPWHVGRDPSPRGAAADKMVRRIDPARARLKRADEPGIIVVRKFGGRGLRCSPMPRVAISLRMGQDGYFGLFARTGPTGS